MENRNPWLNVECKYNGEQREQAESSIKEAKRARILRGVPEAGKENDRNTRIRTAYAMTTTTVDVEGRNNHTNQTNNHNLLPLHPTWGRMVAIRLAIRLFTEAKVLSHMH